MEKTTPEFEPLQYILAFRDLPGADERFEGRKVCSTRAPFWKPSRRKRRTSADMEDDWTFRPKNKVFPPPNKKGPCPKTGAFFVPSDYFFVKRDRDEADLALAGIGT